jgi:hypothetical protein
MKHTGNILINGHKQALAYGISVRGKKNVIDRNNCFMKGDSLTSPFEIRAM